MFYKESFLYLAHITIIASVINSVIPDNLHYEEYSLEDYRLCSPVTKRKIKLGGGLKPSALIITQKRLNYHPIEWEKNNFCKFEVKANEKHAGIFAVIQDIVFRKNETTGECIDYIQFKSKHGYTSRKFCGRSNAALTMDQLFVNENLQAHNPIAELNTFVDPKGELDVYVFVAKEPLKVDEEIEINLVFTVYRDCTYTHYSDYKPCFDEVRQQLCINKEYFGDGIVNCPYLNCVDEGDCSFEDKDPIKRKPIGNKVLIGYVTSLVLMFGLFIVCLYVCRKFGKLCWSDNCINRRTSRNSQPPIDRVIELNQSVSLPQQRQSEPEVPTTTPSAPLPPLTQANKDLPPSYDSLFPTS